jgi:hypothetical protein
MSNPDQLKIAVIDYGKVVAKKKGTMEELDEFWKEMKIKYS